MGIVEETLPNYMIEDLITEGVYDLVFLKQYFYQVDLEKW